MPAMPADIEHATLWMDMREAKSPNPFRLTLTVQGKFIKEWVGGLNGPENPFGYFEYPELFALQGRSAQSIPQWVCVEIPAEIIPDRGAITVRLTLLQNQAPGRPSVLIGSYARAFAGKSVWEGPRPTRKSSDTSAVKYLYDSEPRLWGREPLASSPGIARFSGPGGIAGELAEGTTLGIRLELLRRDKSRVLL